MQAVDRTKAPQIHDFTGFKPEKPVVSLLGNGIALKQFVNPQLDLLHFIIKIKAGRYYESKKNAALFCYLLLKESSSQYSCSEVDEFLDYYGVSYTANVTIEYAIIKLIIPRNNCFKVLPYIFDFLAHPSFKEKNLEILRQRKLMDLAYNQERVSYCASQLMLHHIFGDQNPAGQIQTEELLKDVSIEDIRQYYQQSFCAENIRLYVAGNLDNNILQTLTQLFETIPHGQTTLLSTPQHIVTPLSEPIIDYHKECIQSSFFLCQQGIAHNDTRRRDFNILSTILGGYFGSRLMSNLRETHGFTYGISCDNLYFNQSSVFYIESEVNVDVTRQAIEECKKEIDRLGQETMPAEELELVKSYMTGQLLRKVDNTVAYMTQYCQWDEFDCDEQEFELQMQSIQDFTSEKSMQLAKDLLQTKNFTTIISGNIQ
ncbi:MAG: insulinase family protein [Bacteroidales bacterium]|nr:insulinase family protein [Bacteroidales bacterium]